MDSKTKEAADKLIRELERLNRNLEASSPRQKYSEAEDDTRQADNHSPEATTISTAVANSRPSPKQQANSKKKWQKPFSWWKARFELAGIVFAIGYAVVTFFQWRDTRTNFAKEERPYIGSNSSGQVTITSSPTFPRSVVQVPYTNYGKSPALHVRTASDVIGPNSDDPNADKWFAKFGKHPMTREEINPGISQSHNLPQTDYERWVAPNEPGGQNVIGAPVDVNGPYFIVLHIEYYDASGNWYWTNACYWHLQGMAGVTKCWDHQEIH